MGVTKQRRSARSSAESEIVAMDEATKATQALRLVLEDLSLADTSNPTPVYVDNQATIKWSHNQSTKKLRHLNIRENAIRDAVAFNEIIPLFVPGKLNLSDLFTKEFKSASHFIALRDLLVIPRVDGGDRFAYI